LKTHAEGEQRGESRFKMKEAKENNVVDPLRGANDAPFRGNLGEVSQKNKKRGSEKDQRRSGAGRWRLLKRAKEEGLPNPVTRAREAGLIIKGKR